MAQNLVPDNWLTRTEMKPETVAYTIPLTSLRVHDAMATNLPATAANDDLGLVTGTPGTDAPTVQVGDVGGASVTRYAAFEFVLPAEYEAGAPITVDIHGGMLTTIADDAVTVDLQVWKATAAGAVGSDLCGESAQSINSLTYATVTFGVTETGLAPGDRLILRVQADGDDTGDAGVMIPEITSIAVNLTVRG